MSEQKSIKIQIEKIIKKSRRALETAGSNFNIKDYEAASSKVYYAVFHIMQAALLLKGLSYSKHSGVISGFSKEFIKIGIFPKTFSKGIARLLKDREISDYSYSFVISKSEAEKDLAIAKEIIEVVERYLLENLQ